MAGAAKFRKAALGFRTHSGWASIVLAAGDGDKIAILDRRHVVLCDSSKAGSKQPFHAAEPMPFAEAESHIELCRKTTENMAREAIHAALATCQKVSLCGVCVITASGRPLPELAAILASHALIHAAEGEFYRDAVAAAANSFGLKTARLKAAEALSHVAMQIRGSENRVTEALTQLGKQIGRPWTSDDKLATLAAWSLLA
jgi:hypothetical protein